MKVSIIKTEDGFFRHYGAYKKALFVLEFKPGMDAGYRIDRFLESIRALPKANGFVKGHKAIIDCPICLGDGVVEQRQNCSKQPSECCGGCIDSVPCSNCTSGEIMVDCDEVQQGDCPDCIKENVYPQEREI